MKHRKSRSQTRPKEKEPKMWLVFALMALMVLVAGAIVALQTGKQQSPSERQASGARSTPQSMPQMTEQELTDTAWDPQWPPLPNAGTLAWPIEQVRAMYAFAARHPEVMRYAPCYCNCDDSQGHESALDCFVKGRDANGKPQWDEMGFA